MTTLVVELIDELLEASSAEFDAVKAQLMQNAAHQLSACMTTVNQLITEKFTLPSTARPHATLIKEWANGAIIEWRFNEFDEWKLARRPSWDRKRQYQVAPPGKYKASDAE